MTVSDIIDGANQFKRQHGVAPQLARVNPVDGQQLAYSLIGESPTSLIGLTVEESSRMTFQLDPEVAVGRVEFS